METTADFIQVDSVEALQEAILRPGRMLPRAGGSKPAMSEPPAGVTTLDVSGLRGITEYQPGEYTISALAGTPIAEIDAALAEHGQSLPFDPPLTSSRNGSATVGGAIASGLNGPLRYRYGGLRDFLIGIRFVDGRGRLLRGGGKVVKNAAGFDFPKLFVGSLGRLGVLVEATFKVFPRPAEFATVRVDYASMAEAATLLRKLATAPQEVHALDVVAEDVVSVFIRVGGAPASLADRANRMRGVAGGGEVLDEETERTFWDGQRRLLWAADSALLASVPVNPHGVDGLDRALSALPARRRYSAGGHVVWMACDVGADALSSALKAQALPGVLVRGVCATPLIGAWSSSTFIRRVQRVLDPDGKFPEY